MFGIQIYPLTTGVIARAEQAERDRDEALEALKPFRNGVPCKKCHKQRSEHVQGVYCFMGDPDADEFEVDVHAMDDYCRRAAEIIAKQKK